MNEQRERACTALRPFHIHLYMIHSTVAMAEFAALIEPQPPRLPRPRPLKRQTARPSIGGPLPAVSLRPIIQAAQQKENYKPRGNCEIVHKMLTRGGSTMRLRNRTKSVSTSRIDKARCSQRRRLLVNDRQRAGRPFATVTRHVSLMTQCNPLWCIFQSGNRSNLGRFYDGRNGRFGPAK